MPFEVGQSVWVRESNDKFYFMAVVADVNPSGTAAKVAYNKQVYQVDIDRLLPANAADPNPPIPSAQENIFNHLARTSRNSAIPARETKVRYTPTVLYDNRWTDNRGGAQMLFSIAVDQCPICGRLMMDSSTQRKSRGSWYAQDEIKEQMKRAGIVELGVEAPALNGRICEICTKEDRATFVCSLCEQPRNISQIKTSFGDPPDYLCQVCFETVTASKWDEATDELHEKHRWDYE